MFIGANLVKTQAQERADRNDQVTSEVGRRPVIPAIPTGQTSWMQRTCEDLKRQAREGSCRSSKGCSRVGRPPRTPSDAVETQEEQ